MSQYFEETEGGDTAFSMRGNHVKFGRGLLDEVGPDAVSLAEYGHSTKGTAIERGGVPVLWLSMCVCGGGRGW